MAVYDYILKWRTAFMEEYIDKSIADDTAELLTERGLTPYLLRFNQTFILFIYGDESKRIDKKAE